MNIVTEANLSGKPIAPQQRKRPVRMLRWFIIVGTLLAALVGGLLWLNSFRGQLIAGFLSKPPPPTLAPVAEAKSGVIPSLRAAVGRLVSVHQVNFTSDVTGRITDISSAPGSSLEPG